MQSPRHPFDPWTSMLSILDLKGSLHLSHWHFPADGLESDKQKLSQDAFRLEEDARTACLKLIQELTENNGSR